MRPRRLEVEIDALVLGGLPPGWDPDAVAAALRDELSARTARRGISGRVAATGRVEPQAGPRLAATSGAGDYGRRVGAAIAKGLAR